MSGVGASILIVHIISKILQNEAKHGLIQILFRIAKKSIVLFYLLFIHEIVHGSSVCHTNNSLIWNRKRSRSVLGQQDHRMTIEMEQTIQYG